MTCLQNYTFFIGEKKSQNTQNFLISASETPSSRLKIDGVSLDLETLTFTLIYLLPEIMLSSMLYYKLRRYWMLCQRRFWIYLFLIQFPWGKTSLKLVYQECFGICSEPPKTVYLEVRFRKYGDLMLESQAKAEMFYKLQLLRCFTDPRSKQKVHPGFMIVVIISFCLNQSSSKEEEIGSPYVHAKTGQCQMWAQGILLDSLSSPREISYICPHISLGTILYASAGGTPEK